MAGVAGSRAAWPVYALHLGMRFEQVDLGLAQPPDTRLPLVPAALRLA
jgi:hypothetical protein